MTLAVKAAVVGQFGVGKTTLAARLARVDGGQRTHVFGLSVASQEGGRFDLSLWDSLEQEKHGPLSSLVYRRAQLVLLVYASDSRESLDALQGWADEARQHAAPGALLLVVAARGDAAPRAVEPAEGRAAAEALGAVAFCECGGDDVSEVLDALTGACELLAEGGLERRRLLEADELRRVREVLLGTEQLFQSALQSKGEEVARLREELAQAREAAPPPTTPQPPQPPRRPGPSPGTPDLEEETDPERLREQLAFTRALVSAHKNATEDLQDYAQVLNRTISELRDELESKTRQLDRVSLRPDQLRQLGQEETVRDLRSQLEATEHLFVESLRVKAEAQAALQSESDELRARAQRLEGIVAGAVAAAEEATLRAEEAVVQAARAKAIASAYYVLQDNDNAPRAEVAKLGGGGAAGAGARLSQLRSSSSSSSTLGSSKTRGRSASSAR